jgi:multiple sugar transport system permease protein
VNHSRLVNRWMQTAVLVLGVLVTLVPLLGLLLNSFKPSNQFYGPHLWPTVLTLANYKEAFASNGTAIANLFNSIIVASSTTLITVVFGTLAAYGLSRARYRWVPIILYAFLLVRFYPKITSVLPYYIMMRSLHLLDTLPAVIIAHVSIALPLVVLVMTTFFREIPQSLEEAAMMDGCSILQCFRHVVLPLVRPALVTAAILTAMMSWNEFLIASSVTGQRAATLPVLVSSFMSDKGIQLGELSAVSVVIILPIALFVLGMQRHLIRGLTMGAVKE